MKTPIIFAVIAVLLLTSCAKDKFDVDAYNEALFDGSWTQVYGESIRSLGYAVSYTNDEGYIACGLQHDEELDENRLYIVKTGSNGDLIWEKTYDQNQAIDILALDNGHFIVSGTTWSKDMLLMEIDGNGNKVWSNSFTHHNFNSAANHCLVSFSDGGYLIGGRTAGANDQALIVKTTSTGTEVWSFIMSDQEYDMGISALAEVEDGYMLLGERRDIPWTTFQSTMYLAKLNFEGDLLWAKYYVNDETEFAADIVVTENKSIYLLGTQGIGGNVSHPRMIVRKTDKYGNIEWEDTYDSYLRPNHQGVSGRAIDVCDNGDLILLGNTNGEEDILVLKISNSGRELVKKAYGVQNYFQDGGTVTLNGNDHGVDLLITKDQGCMITGFSSAFKEGGTDLLLMKLNSDLRGRYRVVEDN